MKTNTLSIAGFLLASLLFSSCFEDANELELRINPFDTDYPFSFGVIHDLSVDSINNNYNRVRFRYSINPDVIADIEHTTDLDFTELYFAYEVYDSEDTSKEPLFYNPNPYLDRHVLNPYLYPTVNINAEYIGDFPVNRQTEKVCICFLLRHGELLFEGDRTFPKINQCVDL